MIGIVKEIFLRWYGPVEIMDVIRPSEGVSLNEVSRKSYGERLIVL